MEEPGQTQTGALSAVEAATRSKARQLLLSLPQNPPRYDRSSFIISESNAAAFQTATSWLQSSEPMLVICGPPRTGKTHLAHIIVEPGDGIIVSVTDFMSGIKLAPLIVIDDFPGAAHGRPLLTALSELTVRNQRAVLAGAGDPGGWSGGLKDLKTRLEAMPRATLLQPDEDLMRKVIAKLFRDRQIDVKKQVIDYAAPRLQRTFAAASAFVVLSDEAAMAANGRISIPIAKKIVTNLSEGLPGA